MGMYVARAGLSFSSHKRPELPRMPSAPRITTFPPVPVTCDAVRNKCRELLTAALQTDRECPGKGCTACLGVLAPNMPLDSRGGWTLPAHRGLSLEDPQGQPSSLARCSCPQGGGRGSLGSPEHLDPGLQVLGRWGCGWWSQRGG